MVDVGSRRDISYEYGVEPTLDDDDADDDDEVEQGDLRDAVRNQSIAYRITSCQRQSTCNEAQHSLCLVYRAIYTNTTKSEYR